MKRLAAGLLVLALAVPVLRAQEPDLDVVQTRRAFVAAVGRRDTVTEATMLAGGVSHDRRALRHRPLVDHSDCDRVRNRNHCWTDDDRGARRAGVRRALGVGNG